MQDIVETVKLGGKRRHLPRKGCHEEWRLFRNEGSSFVLTEGRKERSKLRLGFPFLRFFQVIDALALLMPSCKSGATSPSSLNTAKQKAFL